MSARALLTLAATGDDTAIYDHIDAYADNAALLCTLLRALSAISEETPSRAQTARRIWPHVVRHVLELNDSGHAALQDHHYGSMALAALIPNAAFDHSYLYREVHEKPIPWWEPLSLRSAVETWLVSASGRADCVNQLVTFLGVLSPEDQVRTGLPWVSSLVLADHAGIAHHAHMLPDWLVEMRSAAVGAGLEARWQALVDALAVAGVTRLAPYSE